MTARAAAVAFAEPPPRPSLGDPRARLVDAALTVVSERGYAATASAEIAAVAGVSTAELERHFAHKEECYLAAYDRAAGWIEEWLQADLAGWNGGWALGVRRAVWTTTGLLAADPRLARVCAAEALFAGPRGLERHRATVERLASALAAGRLQRPAGAEELPADLERTLLGGAILSLGRAPRPLEMAPEVVYFLLAPYVGTAEARRLAGA